MREVTYGGADRRDHHMSGSTGSGSAEVGRGSSGHHGRSLEISDAVPARISYEVALVSGSGTRGRSGGHDLRVSRTAAFMRLIASQIRP
jgi:hypothetical protein